MNRRTIDPVLIRRPVRLHRARGPARSGRRGAVDPPRAGWGRPRPAGHGAICGRWRRYPAGTTVMPARAAVRTIDQGSARGAVVPDARWPSPSAPIDCPYRRDRLVVGHVDGRHPAYCRSTLPGGADDARDGSPMPSGRVSGSGPIFLLPHESNTSLTATARLLAGGAEVAWARTAVQAADETFPAGVGIVRHVPLKTMVRLADDLGIDIVATDREPDVAVLPLRGRVLRSTSPGAAPQTLDGRGGSSISTTCDTPASAARDCTTTRS